MNTSAKRVKISATAAEWARIAERAGTTPIEQFVLACAVAGEASEDGTHPLALSPVEQRQLARRVERVAQAHDVLFARLPGAGLSLYEALDVICRAAHRER